ncbi:MAG: hypothetical protein ACRDHL_08280 [Candidatus Promineifilaceae bacterium]
MPQSGWKGQPAGPGAGLANEDGQSIVLVVLVFLGLLGFVALAADAGFAFMRSSQFSRAVDSATLAGVVDLDPGPPAVLPISHTASLRAQQFLAANGWPTPTLTVFSATRSFSNQGIPQLTISATWPAELFFISLFGIEEVAIRHAATAAYYAASEMVAPTGFDQGGMRLAHQFISGPQGCTAQGDPVMPGFSTPGVPNAERSLYPGAYAYRIVIPSSYTPTTVLVELFDTDSYNLRASDAGITVSHSLDHGGPPEALACSATAGTGDRCIIETGESSSLVTQNPYWLHRVDQTWDTSCNLDAANAVGDSFTKFTLYSIEQDDGTRTPLGVYTDTNGLVNDTDLKWVAPGSSVSPAVPADFGSFEVTLSGVDPDPATGSRNLFLEVTTNVALTGASSSLNGWDVFARPPDSNPLAPPNWPADVNARNLDVANNVFDIQETGVRVYALGRMPSYYLVGNQQITLPLLNLPIEAGEGSMYVSAFDLETAGTFATQFTISSVGTDQFRMCAEVSATPLLGQSGECVDGPDPDGVPNPLQASCGGDTDCNNGWLRPQFAMGVPGGPGGFSGGILQLLYTPNRDAVTWSAQITQGRPFLTR